MNFAHEDIFWLFVFVLIFSLLLICAIINWLIGVNSELKYINMELKRCEGEERKIWLKRKWELFFSFLPFIRR